MPPEKPQFAKNISFLRNQLRLTIDQAATGAGIKPSTWKSYEKGRGFPHHKKLPGICKVLQYYDILALINRDLANDKEVNRVDADDAAQSLKKIEQFLKQQKPLL